MPALNLATGLRMIGSGVFIEHATLSKVALKARAATSTPCVVDGAVVGQHRGREFERLCAAQEHLAHVRSLDGAITLTAQNESQVVVDEGEDLHCGAVCKLVVSHVGLPALIRPRRLKAHVACFGTLAWFAGDEPSTLQDAVDRRR